MSDARLPGRMETVHKRTPQFNASIGPHEKKPVSSRWPRRKLEDLQSFVGERKTQCKMFTPANRLSIFNHQQTHQRQNRAKRGDTNKDQRNQIPFDRPTDLSSRPRHSKSGRRVPKKRGFVSSAKGYKCFILVFAGGRVGGKEPATCKRPEETRFVNLADVITTGQNRPAKF